MTLFKNLILVVFLTLIPLMSAEAFFYDHTKITLKIVAEDGSSIEGADVGIGFQYNGRNGTDYKKSVGRSTANGLFSATAVTNGHVGWTVTKTGYYESIGSFDFNKDANAKWEPWNPTVEVLLRKIEKQVPMFARNTKYSSLEIPVVGEAVGFDLIRFDWVPPYGRGSEADLIFHLERRVVDRENFEATLTVTFSNEDDGIQLYQEELKGGSLFKLPRYAELDGYQDRLVLKEWRNPNDYNVKRNFDFLASNVNYIFRIRSELKDGGLVRAMYGKVIGRFGFDSVFSKTADIYFQYYLNPDYTRNLEFDPNLNLFKNLSKRERVRIK